MQPRKKKRRWRMLYCRAVLDSKSATQEEKQAARKELRDMYHCQKDTSGGCRP